jgi:hypothetical protein
VHSLVLRSTSVWLAVKRQEEGSHFFGSGVIASADAASWTEERGLSHKAGRLLAMHCTSLNSLRSDLSRVCSGRTSQSGQGC